MEYDEDGSLALARALGVGVRSAARDEPTASPPCKVGALDGSWYLQLTPKGPHTLTEIRGPMRIEVAPPKLRVSGDIYVRKPAPDGGPIEILRPITEKPLLFGKNWYPQLPFDQYSWYFRSLGVKYEAGVLVVKIERHLWNRITQEFVSAPASGLDNAFLKLECREGNIFTHPLLPQPTLRMIGTAQVGEEYDAVATKTSPFYRGCAVEVDVMKNRSFPLTATTVAGAAISFASVYRTAGMDCAVEVDQTNLPEDDDLSTVELQTALATNRRPATNPDAWRLWLLVGSAQGDIFGLMFDDTAPFREGTAGFFDPRFSNDPVIAPSARGKKLGEVPAGFLRTLVHEAGHAFNLFHPKHDVHNVPIGTTIMNQTGDVMGFASPANPYPGNVTFEFDDHNRSSLIHSPDPQVAPGWKRFGWGHGSLSEGIPEPVDAAGFHPGVTVAADITLEIVLPHLVYRGQFVAAEFTVTNRGARPRTITSAINLSQGDLRLLVTPPADELHDVRDVIVACGDRPFVTLEPGQSITGTAQVFYTNVGFTFRQSGRYFVSAELDLGDRSGAIARSNTAAIVVRAPVTAEEERVAELSMEFGVGRAFAFGDYGTDAGAKKYLEELAAKYPHTESGAAAALTLANSHGRDLRDLYSGQTLRKADKVAAKAQFVKAAEASGGDLTKLVRTSVAVAAPTEASAPVLEMADAYLTSAAGAASADVPKGRKRKARSAEAESTPAVDSDARGAADALDYLNDIRRTLARGK